MHPIVLVHRLATRPLLITVVAASAALLGLFGTTPAFAQQSSLAISDYTAIEGDAGSSDATFTVRLSAASPLTVTVDFATADGSATPPADYEPRSGTLTFLPGEASKSVLVPVRGDTAQELDETFTVNLSNAANAAVADGQGIGTILNQDPPAPPAGPLIGFVGPVRVASSRVGVGLRCSGAAEGRCRGDLTLSLQGATRQRAGKARFSIASGRRARVRVKLSRQARRALARRGRVRARIVATASDAGGQQGTLTRTVTLRAPRGAPRFTG